MTDHAYSNETTTKASTIKEDGKEKRANRICNIIKKEWLVCF